VAYSKDLRERAVVFVREGGSKAEASRRFKVSKWCVYDWLCREVLTPNKTGPKGSYRLDMNKLLQELEDKPDATLNELAQHVNMSYTAVRMALKKENITRKKNVALPGAHRRTA